jgi:hypothetical protein
MSHVRALTALLSTFHLGKQTSAVNQVLNLENLLSPKAFVAIDDF